MKTIQELLQLRAAKIDELSALVDKMNAEGYVAEKSDDDAYAAVKKDIADIDKSIERKKDADALKASVAQVVSQTGERSASVPAQVRQTYGRLKAFKDRHDDRGAVVRAEDQAYAAGQFFLATLFDSKSAAEWCQKNGIVVTRAQGESTNSLGGFLVPSQFMNTIIDLKEQFGVFRANAQLVPMSSDLQVWPRRTGGVSAYFTGENTAVTESNGATWDNVNLAAKKLAVLVRMSTEIGDDAVISIADWLTREIAYAFASKEDDCGFNGDGTSTYGGITGLTATGKVGSAGLYTATGHATFDVLTATDIESMRALLPFYALPNAKFYCSQYAFALCFERLIAAGGGNTITTLGGEVQYRYLGTPIVISQKLPSTSPTGKIAIFYGDLALAATFGERRVATIMRSDQRYMEYDQIGILGTQRFDIVNHDVGDSTNAGPIVALKMG